MNKIAETIHDKQIVQSIDKTTIRAESIRLLLDQNTVTDEVVNAFGRILHTRYTRRLCKFLPTSFFEGLYNPMGKAKYRTKAQLDLDKVKGFTADVNIFEYQILLIPVLVHNHWTLIYADTRLLQVGYLDSDGDGGLEYILAVRRWLAREWKRFYKTPFPDWRTVPSSLALIPQQGDTKACGIFMLMNMTLLADGQDVSRFNRDHIGAAREYIAHSILSYGCPDEIETLGITYRRDRSGGRINL